MDSSQKSDVQRIGKGKMMSRNIFRAGLAIAVGLVLIAAYSGIAQANSHETNQWITDWIDGFNKYGKTGDTHIASVAWAKDSVRKHPLAGEILGYQGHVEFYAGLWKDWGDQVFVEYRRVVQGRQFSVEGVWHATQRESGKRVELLLILSGVWNEDGKIIEATEIFDTGAFTAQLE